MKCFALSILLLSIAQWQQIGLKHHTETRFMGSQWSTTFTKIVVYLVPLEKSVKLV